MAGPRIISAVHQGVAFEQRALRLLEENLSMSLRRVGGKSDGGVDLLGWWWLPPLRNSNIDNCGAPVTPHPENHYRHQQLSPSSTKRTRLRILAQCKAEKKKTAPKYIRELEGVTARLSSSQSSSSTFPVVSLFVSESAFTRAAILRAHSSAFPFFLLHIPPLAPRALESNGNMNGDTERDASGHDLDDGEIGTALWNPALSRILGDRMQVRWERGDNLQSTTSSGRPAVWHQPEEGPWERLRNWTPESDVMQEDDEEFADKVKAGMQ
ncbi:hypothetical protein BDV98DRAFT_94904 [Pterulicium gracile]|uniref:Restriction endonuclease type IV Mrr domain-containing protein n=1 Tax=Pterulicium gracile TaxID=1884261 RepID=A0A5C3QFC8_9AGAR|nr:hypothetical protein BDV98DRAFT_94904 [Pterula gracilis]